MSNCGSLRKYLSSLVFSPSDWKSYQLRKTYDNRYSIVSTHGLFKLLEIILIISSAFFLLSPPPLKSYVRVITILESLLFSHVLLIVFFSKYFCKVYCLLCVFTGVSVL